MASVFISYTHADAEYARKVHRSLVRKGHRVWLDEFSLRASTSIPVGVADGMGKCDFLAIVATTHALQKSVWIQAELEFFIGDKIERRKKILPLRFGNINPLRMSELMRSINPKCVDFRSSYVKGIKELLEVLGPADSPKPRQRVAEQDDRLQFAIDLAVRAGSVAMRFYNRSMQRNISLDQKKSATTLADRAAQYEILAELVDHEKYGKGRDGIVSEHHPFDNLNDVREHGYTWVVDPLDGTVNFDSRIPLFCTAIGCLRDRRPYIGVIYDPVENEVYYAIDGQGAEVWNISKGEVRRITCDRSTDKLENSVLGIHISSRADVAKRFIKSGMLLDLSLKARHLRALGSGQLALAYVASGKLQGFLQLQTFIWDQVAGVVLVRSAGGCVANPITGEGWKWDTEDLVAVGNRRLKKSMLAFTVHHSPKKTNRTRSRKG